MIRKIPIGGAAAMMLIAGAAPVALSGCAGPHPWVRDGTATAVEISYAGDVATTLPLAQKHCARFERVPRLLDPGIDIASFECVRP